MIEYLTVNEFINKVRDYSCPVSAHHWFHSDTGDLEICYKDSGNYNVLIHAIIINKDNIIETLEKVSRQESRII
jgi:hypothetical protein